MARPLRFDQVSEANCYHVTTRGAGRRAIFDDDADKKRYLECLFDLIDESKGALMAWCLMDNHTHVLFQLELHALSDLMHRLNTTYAQYFNGRHGHVGPVFQSRFDSRPNTTDAQLLMTVAYIHHNPKNLDGGNWRTYPWSSYVGYLTGASHCDGRIVIKLTGGPKGFLSFHANEDDTAEVRLDGYRRRLTDFEAHRILVERYGNNFDDMLAALPHNERNAELLKLHASGLSTRQIERLTGIGRGIVNRAIAKQWDYWLK